MSSLIKKYLWVLTLLCVLVISYLLAKIASLFIASQFPDVLIAAKKPKTGLEAISDAARQEVDLGMILKRNFFDAEESRFASAEDIKTDETVNTSDTSRGDTGKIKEPQNQVAVKTSLNISLIGTTSVSDGRNKLSSCVIRSGREQDVYRVWADPSFAEGTKITRILPKRVEFLNKGRLEYVDLVDFAKGQEAFNKPETLSQLPVRTKTVEAEDTGDIQREGNTFQIPRAEVDKALANISRLYTEIRAVPYFKDGKANGFKLLNVKAGSLFEKLGLRRGDILKSINGNMLDIQSGLKLFNELKNESNFTLEVERRGAEQAFKYDII